MNNAVYLQLKTLARTSRNWEVLRLEISRFFLISQTSKYTRSSNSKLPFAKGNICEDLETLEDGYLWKQPRTL